MELVNFMIHRFMNIEGVLVGVKSFNLDTCIFENGMTLKYDLRKWMVKIISPDGMIANVKLGECTKDFLVNDFGFKERTENRHRLSYGE